MNQRKSRLFRATAIAVALAASCAIFVGVRAAETTESAILAVGADKSGDLVLRSQDGVARTLIHGGMARRKPVFSPDGSRIAFVQATDPHLARAALVVVDLDGHELTRVLIEPVVGETRYAGMRYVEAIRWLTPNRLVVRGSLNPSQSQYYVVDIASGRLLDDVIDDTSSAVWSPDALHVATTTGEPHFESDEDHAPSIEIDRHMVYPTTPTRDIAIVASPQWSTDGRSLGWVVLHRPDKSLASVVWRAGAVQETRLGRVPPDNEFGAFWAGNRLIVTESTPDTPEQAVHAWAIESGMSRPVAPSEAVDPLRDARRQREHLIGEAMEAGLVQPDVWCRQCPLRALPRASD
jgi:hypothetical protein